MLNLEAGFVFQICEYKYYIFDIIICIFIFLECQEYGRVGLSMLMYTLAQICIATILAYLLLSPISIAFLSTLFQPDHIAIMMILMLWTLIAITFTNFSFTSLNLSAIDYLLGYICGFLISIVKLLAISMIFLKLLTIKSYNIGRSLCNSISHSNYLSWIENFRKEVNGVETVDNKVLQARLCFMLFKTSSKLLIHLEEQANVKFLHNLFHSVIHQQIQLAQKMQSIAQKAHVKYDECDAIKLNLKDVPIEMSKQDMKEQGGQ